MGPWSSEHCRADKHHQIGVPGEKLVQRVHRRTVTDELGRPHTVLVICPEEVRKLSAQFSEDSVVHRLIECQARRGVGAVELHPPRVWDRLKYSSADDLRPMCLVPISGGQQGAGASAGLEYPVSVLEHRDA